MRSLLLQWLKYSVALPRSVCSSPTAEVVGLQSNSNSNVKLLLSDSIAQTAKTTPNGCRDLGTYPPKSYQHTQTIHISAKTGVRQFHRLAESQDRRTAATNIRHSPSAPRKNGFNSATYGSYLRPKMSKCELKKNNPVNIVDLTLTGRHSVGRRILDTIPQGSRCPRIEAPCSCFFMVEQTEFVV